MSVQTAALGLNYSMKLSSVGLWEFCLLERVFGRKKKIMSGSEKTLGLLG